MDRSARRGIVGRAALGAAAGAVATAAMDLVWYRRYRASGGDSDLRTWEFTTSATDFGDEAPAPARVGKRIADAVGVRLDDGSVASVNNVVHWMTGIGWGTAAGVVGLALPVPALAAGIGAGVVAWTTSYVLLGAIGIYQPITSYDIATLWKDLSAHLVFGTTMGIALTLAR